MPEFAPISILPLHPCNFLRLRIEQSLPADFFLEWFEERNDQDDDDEDEGKGGEDGAGLETFESTGPQQNGGRERLNDPPGKFYMIGWVEATIGGERPQHEGGGICGGDEKGADQKDGNEGHDCAHGVLL